MSDFQEFVNLLQSFCLTLENHVRNHFKLSRKAKILIQKRNRQLSRGEFMIVVQEWKPKCKRYTQTSSCSGSANETGDDAVAQSDCSCEIDISGFTPPDCGPLKSTILALSDKCDIFLRLERHLLFSAIINHVEQVGVAYGHSLNKGMVLLSPGIMDTSLDGLRSILLADHINGLLRANGYEVIQRKQRNSPEDKTVFADFDIPIEDYFSDVSDDQEKILQKIRDSKYYEEDDTINLKQYMTDHDISSQYSKNITCIKCNEERVRHVTSLEQQYKQYDQLPQHVIHLGPQRHSMVHQSVDLLWRVVNDSVAESLKQIHLHHAPVNCRKAQMGEVETAQELLNLRKEAVSQASVMKYGPQVEGDEWKGRIQSLAVAAVKFDLLATTYTRPVKLDLQPCTSDCLETHPGVFVLYNCARISVLLQKYASHVGQGIYPPLPDVETLDFKLLRQEDEWVLMFNYILVYPSLVSDCVVLGNDGSLHIQTHKVCQFLQDLSRDLSSYYCRTHILTEGREHLLPVMFCRLYLLKSLHQVILNGLSLLNIQPVTQL